MEDEHDLRWIYEHVHDGAILDWNPEVIVGQPDTVDVLGVVSWDGETFFTMPHPLWVDEAELWQEAIRLLKTCVDGTALAREWEQEPESGIWMRAIPRGDYVEVQFRDDDDPAT